MNRSKKLVVKAALAVVALGGGFAAISLTFPSEAKADPYHHFHSHAPQYAPRITHRLYVPHYHAPSIHFDRVYHADYYHWTPSRGLHSHGHFHTVPHYTPGYLHW